MIRLIEKYLYNILLTVGGILVIAVVIITSKYQLNEVINPIDEGVKVPIVMYHSVLNSSKRSSKYVITPDQLEKDLLYIKEMGFETIQTKDLINYVENDIPLPEKPIIITFDDGYYNNFSYLYPILQKYNFKAVLSIVGTSIDTFSAENTVLNNNYSYIPWDLLKEIQSSGLIEIQNHTYNMHDLSKRKGILRKKGEDYDNYKEILINDITRLQDEVTQNIGETPTAFTYPFGAVNKESEEIVNSLGFKVTYGCEEGINIITKDPQCLLRLNRYNKSGLVKIESLLTKIMKKMD